jgi:osmotically-inducible protein OsmY
MRRAGHQRPSSIRATAPPPSAARGAVTLSVRLLDESVLPDKSDSNSARGDVSIHRGAAQETLEIAIQQRIESRLQGRVRNLKVRAYADLVILEGQCSTYYTKQLAQHAAMGVLEDEQLENAIVVGLGH